MSTIQVKFEGHTIDLPEEITQDDQRIKDSLAPFYPQAANATIERKTKEGVTTISLLPQPGKKGTSPLTSLRRVKSFVHPARALYTHIQELGVRPTTLNAWPTLPNQVSEVLETSEKLARQTHQLLTVFQDLPATSRQTIPIGF